MILQDAPLADDLLDRNQLDELISIEELELRITPGGQETVVPLIGLE